MWALGASLQPAACVVPSRILEKSPRPPTAPPIPPRTTQGRPSFHNPIFGESLYELCRRATTRQIDQPDEILNQQVRLFVMLSSVQLQATAARDLRPRLVGGSAVLFQR
jgi:hypothetical protein